MEPQYTDLLGIIYSDQTWLERMVSTDTLIAYTFDMLWLSRKQKGHFFSSQFGEVWNSSQHLKPKIYDSDSSLALAKVPFQQLEIMDHPPGGHDAMSRASSGANLHFALTFVIPVWM